MNLLKTKNHHPKDKTNYFVFKDSSTSSEYTKMTSISPIKIPTDFTNEVIKSKVKKPMITRPLVNKTSTKKIPCANTRAYNIEI